MESPHSSLLPEVDSLPDGFVDGAREAEEQTCHEIEKAEKPRTFPVPLCEETDELSLEQKESLPVCQTSSDETASSTHSLKPKKQDVVETKRKGSKNMFKSEKEFLEFMLKYQQVLSERDSAIAVRDKLESLCRELQRQNKMLMEECKRVSTEGQTLRSDLSTKFQEAIKVLEHIFDVDSSECLDIFEPCCCHCWKL